MLWLLLAFIVCLILGISNEYAFLIILGIGIGLLIDYIPFAIAILLEHKDAE